MSPVPVCGRTLFNLQTTTAQNQSGDSASKRSQDRDHGLHRKRAGRNGGRRLRLCWGAPGKVNLYVGKQAVKFNIPEAEAVDRLKDLIREHGKWVEPATQPALAEANA